MESILNDCCGPHESLSVARVGFVLGGNIFVNLQFVEYNKLVPCQSSTHYDLRTRSPCKKLISDE